jgi:hypothetical protein
MQSQIAILTVSHIDSRRRLASAQAALASLRDCLKAEHDIFAVDDLPRWGKGFLKSRLPDPQLFTLGRTLYDQQNVHLRRRYHRGSRTALVEALTMAEKAGYNHVFIHLDDNVYLPALGVLLQGAEDALSKDKKLKIVKLVGYPLLTHQSDPFLGNRTFINQKADRLHFDQYQFSPRRETDYTLWHAKLNPEMYCGPFWPIGLWSAVYDTTYLKKILLAKYAAGCFHLAEVEKVYRDRQSWQEFISQNPGSIGFINMQFCGFETEKNENWPTLIQSPNEPIY